MDKSAAGLGRFLGTTLKGAHRLATSPQAHKAGRYAIKGMGHGIRGFGKAWETSPTLRRVAGTSVLGAGLGAVPGAIGGAIAPGDNWMTGAIKGGMGGGVLGGLAGLGMGVK